MHQSHKEKLVQLAENQLLHNNIEETMAMTMLENEPVYSLNAPPDRKLAIRKPFRS